MKVDFSQPVKTLQGENIKDPDGKDFTLQAVCTNALLAESEEKISGQEKCDRYALALAIHAAVEPYDLSAENISKLKDLVGKTYTTLVVGQAFQMLDPK